MQSRTNARLAAVQALYQMETGGAGVESVVAEFRAHRLGGELEGALLHDADEEFFADLLRGVLGAQGKIDPLIDGNLSRKWTLARLDATARAILRAAVYELIHRPDVPAKAAIDEYMEIAKAFFGEEEPKFINAVLDAICKSVREDEICANGNAGA